MTIPSARSRAEIVGALRRLIPEMEGFRTGARVVPFGLPALDAHLPHGGLACGALHEVAPATPSDMPAAFGFVLALLGRMPGRGPVLLILSLRKLARCGRPHGHGLNGLGLDPARLVLAETANEKAALWATEEALRSGAPAAVASAIGARLDLKTSQRLQLAARASGLPLLLLRPAGTLGASVAATRWRIGAAEGERDRFGLLAGWRWRATLERCRNGRPGAWVLELDHVTHRLGLAAAVAGPALSQSAGADPVRRAG